MTHRLEHRSANTASGAVGVSVTAFGAKSIGSTYGSSTIRATRCPLQEDEEELTFLGSHPCPGLHQTARFPDVAQSARRPTPEMAQRRTKEERNG